MKTSHEQIILRNWYFSLKSFIHKTKWTKENPSPTFSCSTPTKTRPKTNPNQKPNQILASSTQTDSTQESVGVTVEYVLCRKSVLMIIRVLYGIKSMNRWEQLNCMFILLLVDCFVVLQYNIQVNVALFHAIMHESQFIMHRETFLHRLLEFNIFSCLYQSFHHFLIF